jgi:hypothetical protein
VLIVGNPPTDNNFISASFIVALIYKIPNVVRHQWLIPVIQATWEAEIGRIMV